MLRIVLGSGEGRLQDSVPLGPCGWIDCKGCHVVSKQALELKELFTMPTRSQKWMAPSQIRMAPNTFRHFLSSLWIDVGWHRLKIKSLRRSPRMCILVLLVLVFREYMAIQVLPVLSLCFSALISGHQLRPSWLRNPSRYFMSCAQRCSSRLVSSGVRSSAIWDWSMLHPTTGTSKRQA